MNATHTDARRKAEDFWREKLLEAQQRYRMACESAVPIAERDATSAIRSDALAEYIRVLGIFSRLILHGERPDEVASKVA